MNKIRTQRKRSTNESDITIDNSQVEVNLAVDDELGEEDFLLALNAIEQGNFETDEYGNFILPDELFEGELEDEVVEDEVVELTEEPTEEVEELEEDLELEVVEEEEDFEDEFLGESALGKARKKLLAKRDIKRASLKEVNESRRVLKLKGTTETAIDDRDVNNVDHTIGLCPACGAAELDYDEEVCPVCGEDTSTYNAVPLDTTEVDTDEDLTVIDIDGVDSILIDDEGHTALARPHVIEDTLEHETHEIVVESARDAEPIRVDSGVLSFVDDTPVSELETGTYEEDEVHEVAFLKIHETVDAITNLIQEQAPDSVTITKEDAGVTITARLDEDLFEVEDEKLVTEAGIDEELEDILNETEDDIEVVEDEDTDFKEAIEVEICLEEVAEGCILHVDEVEDVDTLLGVLESVFPEDVTIREAEVEKDVVEEAIEEATGEEVEYEGSINESGTITLYRNGATESKKVRVRSFKKAKKVTGGLSSANESFFAGRQVANLTTKQKAQVVTTLEAGMSKQVNTAKKIFALAAKESATDDNVLKVIDVVADLGTNIKQYKSGIASMKTLTTTLESTRLNKRK